MSEYLVSRADGAPPAHVPVDEVGIVMFFQMWATRQDPFHTLEDGDTLWWVDRKSRTVCWQLRVVNLRRARYESIHQALERLRRWFGVLPGDLNDYHHSARTEGWLLAWENEPIATVGLRLPEGERLGRNGFRRLDDRTARSLGLPRPGRPALLSAQPLGTEPDVLALDSHRTIPLHVRRSVFERDGRVCRECGSVEGPFHLDHVHPWSKGGSNHPDNLQVLCAACNMAKGASISQPGQAVPALPSLTSLSRGLGVRTPAHRAALTHVLSEAIKGGLLAEVVHAMWDVYHHPDLDEGLADSVLAATNALPGEWLEHHKLFDVLTGGPVDKTHLRSMLRSSPEVSTRAASFLAWSLKGSAEQRIALVEQAIPAPDLRVEAHARLLRAELCEDDNYDWTDDILFAVDHGDALTSTRAALRVGSAELDDDTIRYSMLERALRSPALLIASEAARMIAEMFADEPEVERVYLRRSDELKQLLRASAG